MTQPSDIALQLALASELPELIYTDSPHGGIRWRTTALVTDQEWLYLVQQCEAKLTKEKDAYTQALWDETGAGMYSVTTQQKWTFVTATWQQRAISYFKVIGKEIE